MGQRPASESEVKAVLVDLDDTIFDHALTCLEAIRRVREEVTYLRSRPLEALWVEYRLLLDAASPVDPGISPGAALRKERWRRIAGTCGVQLSDLESSELSQRYREFYQSSRRPVPGAVELVRRLHESVPVAVVTNNEVAEQEEKVRFLNLTGEIDALVVSEAVKSSKPDPVIFRTALERVGADADEAVMLGDSWANDVTGAAALGIRPVWFNRFALPLPPTPKADEVRSLEPSSEVADRLLRHDSATTVAGDRAPKSRARLDPA